MKNVITAEVRPALEGAIPAVIATASLNGIPNVTYVWQVFYVDETHVALSRQYFNKTANNISQNTAACVLVTSPLTQLMYKLHLQFLESQYDGPILEKMVLQMQVLANMQGTHEIGELICADIFKITKIEKLQL